jgi:CHAT domain-containing protein/tetratricopeptide (TPR) repeat protein
MIKKSFVVALLIAMKASTAFTQTQDDVGEAGELISKVTEYAKSGNYAKALPLQERAAAIAEKATGSNSLDTAALLNNLAQTYQAMGNYVKALPLEVRAVAIAEQALGADHPDTAALLNNLANTYQSMGNYVKALPLEERVLAIREKILGPDHPETALTLNSLASTYQSMGKYAKALPLEERAVAIAEKSLGPDHPNTSVLISNLANTYQSMEDYAKALPLHEQVLAMREKILGPNDPETAASLNNLAVIYQAMGNNAKAMPLEERAMAIAEKSLGPDHPTTAALLNNLAVIYQAMGNNSKALSLGERVLAMREKSLGPDHPETAASLYNLADTYKVTGNNAKALTLGERAVAIEEKSLGPDHPDTALSLIQLANTYKVMGNYAKALPLQERAVAIAEKSLGPNNRITLNSLLHLSIIRYLNGYDLPNIRVPLEKMYSSKDRCIETILSVDEHTRNTWRQEFLKYDMIEFLQTEQIAQFVLHTKGVVLDSLMEDRVALKGFGVDSPEWLEVQSARFRIGKIAFSKQPEDQEEVRRLKDLIDTTMSAASNLRKKSGRIRDTLTISPASIKTALPPGGLLIDFIQFNDPKITGDARRCYGALLLGWDGSSKFVRLNDAAAIDEAISASREALFKGDDQGMITQQKALSAKLWEPLAKNMPAGTTKLFIGGDGTMNFLSFAALQSTDGSFLAEHYEICYVGSGRDLTRKGSAASSKTAKSITLFADPVFDRKASSFSPIALAMRSGEIDELGRIVLPPLPGTRAEEALVEEVAKSLGWSTDSHLGEKAAKSQLTALKSPAILHLATHGFYLNSLPQGADGVGAAERGMKVIESYDGKRPTAPPKIDPMHASGIALTGAQTTLKAWSEGKVPDAEDDGILTAEEVAGLDLDDTWLVTLSACETGVGQVQSGEGVFGLRRAFMMAGAQNLLMTLWPVSDETTPKFMADFYKEALSTHDAAGSLAKVQKDWLVKLRNEKGLLAAVRDAGPFAMVVMANPNLKESSQKSTVQENQSQQNQQVSTQVQSVNNSSNIFQPSNYSEKILSFDDASQRAESGDAYSQAVLSMYYCLGYLADKDLNKSAKYAMKSAAQGSPLGIYRLGIMRGLGLGMKKDEAQAKMLKIKSFEGLKGMSEDPYALCELAQMAEEGIGVKKNEEEATKLYKLSADLGYAPAMYIYGTCVATGKGTLKNEESALIYIKKAADLGFAEAKDLYTKITNSTNQHQQ